MRVVSLVPSATETLLALGVVPVACTRFCEQPGVPTVGGTKDPHVAEIIGLAPDLVVVNDEENRFEDAARLLDAGLALHSMSPRSVADVGASVHALAVAVRVPPPPRFTPRAWSAWLEAVRRRPARGSACTLVWRRPWTATGADTYGSSVVELLGLANVLGREPERYPPARYPEVSLAEVAGLAPDVVLLPSEPYPFRARHADEVRAEVPRARVLLCDGRDLFWWGARTPGAVTRLAAALSP